MEPEDLLSYSQEPGKVQYNIPQLAGLLRYGVIPSPNSKPEDYPLAGVRCVLPQSEDSPCRGYRGSICHGKFLHYRDRLFEAV
jgi:hypothetical protein